MTRVAVATTPVTVVDVVLVVFWDTAISTLRMVVAGAVTPRSEQREDTFVGAKRRRRGVERSGQVVGRAPRRTMMEGRRWVVVVDVDVVVVDVARGYVGGGGEGGCGGSVGIRGGQLP